MAETHTILPAERIESAILFIRGYKVMLDHHLAKLYEVPIKVLNQAVKRNQERFPSDFMFQLTPDESQVLRSQFVTLKLGRGRHSKHLPYAFTEQGVALLSTVLRSKRAVAVNIEIKRAFVRLRRLLASNEELARRFDAIENKYERQFKVVFDVIRELMTPPTPKRRRIGFLASEKMVYGLLKRLSPFATTPKAQSALYA